MRRRGAQPHLKRIHNYDPLAQPPCRISVATPSLHPLLSCFQVKNKEDCSSALIALPSKWSSSSDVSSQRADGVVVQVEKLKRRERVKDARGQRAHVVAGQVEPLKRSELVKHARGAR